MKCRRWAKRNGNSPHWREQYGCSIHDIFLTKEFLNPIKCNLHMQEGVIKGKSMLCGQNTSCEMFFECLTEQPNPHSAGRRRCAASGCGTSAHPPGGAASSYSSPHLAATSASMPGARSWNRSQEPRDPGSSCPLLYPHHTVMMTENLWVTSPLSPKAKKMSELQSPLVHLWLGGCCRKQEGKSGMNPETGTSLVGCKRNRKKEYKWWWIKAWLWSSWRSLWFHYIHPFGVYLSKHFKCSACQEIKITLIFIEISLRHQSQTTTKSCRQWTY